MKKLIGVACAAGFTLAVGVGAATAAPKSSPANCVGQTVSAHTRNGLASGPALVSGVKAYCRDGIPFHPPA